MAQAVLTDSFQEFGSQAQNNGVGDPQQFLRSKKRADNYSRKDKERLIKLVTSRLDILENKISNTSVNLQKAQCWVEIANEYNQGITVSDNWRDDRQLKDLWKRMKFTARSDLIRHAKQKEKKNSRNNNHADDDSTRGSSSSPAQDILDDFTVILLRLVPAHFQMDTDGKVLQVIDELLALSPDEVEQQKVLSRNRRQERRQQMTEYYGNPDDDDDDDDNAVVLLEVNSTSPDDKSVVILDSCLPPLQGPNNPNTASTTGTQVATGSERLNNNNNPTEKTFYTETVINPQSTTTVSGGILHRPQQVIDIRTGIENSQLQRQPQISSQPLLPPLVTSSTNSLQPSSAPSLQQQQTVLQEQPMFTCKSETDTSIMNDTSRQNWYIEQIGSQNQFADAITDTTLTNIEKDYQYRRKRKSPFYRALLDDDRSDDIQQQLIEIARKENEKEMQLLDAQMQCEKQRLVREKIETENAVLKQRLLLQLLQSQNNKELPSISLLL